MQVTAAQPKLEHMPPAWVLTSILIFIHGVILGLSFMAMFGERLVGKFGSEFTGGLIGGALAAIVSMIVWILTYQNERRKERESKDALRRALWNDVCCLQDIAYREAEWWRQEMKDPRFGATEERFFSHIESAVLEKNMNRITDVPVRAADALLAMRAGTTIIRGVIGDFYRLEDKIIADVRAKKLSEEDGNKPLQANKARVFHSLCRVAADARQASKFLDPDDALERDRRASFTPEEWAIRGKEFETMSATLDAMLERRRTGMNS